MACTVVLAVDSFKGCATSREVERWLAQGVRQEIPDVQIQCVPLADGGEGTVDALRYVRGADVRTAQVTGPCGGRVPTTFVLLNESTAVLEMAQSSGIMLTDRTEASAVRASTYGVGEQILAALDVGVRRIYVGLGGSATSDGGSGMAKALGARFLDAEGEPVPCGLAGLEHLARIDLSDLDPRIRETEFIALSDVRNRLVGVDGSIYIYGAQKGIEPADMERFDCWMAQYAHLLEETCGSDVASKEGSGAAGGLGAALMAFCGARVESGIDFVLDATEFDRLLADADMVVTGEGRIDGQSACGKAPMGVASRARCANIPVIAVAGGRDADLSAVYEAGIDVVLTCNHEPQELEEALRSAERNLVMTGETIGRICLLSERLARR